MCPDMVLFTLRTDSPVQRVKDNTTNLETRVGISPTGQSAADNPRFRKQDILDEGKAQILDLSM